MAPSEMTTAGGYCFDKSNQFSAPSEALLPPAAPTFGECAQSRRTTWHANSMCGQLGVGSDELENLFLQRPYVSNNAVWV